ncbi:hypothetical protein D3C76_1051380 [compost metagenome]
MSNDEARSPFHQRLQPFLNLDLGHCINTAGCFIKHKHRGVSKNRSRNGEQLLLPLAYTAAIRREHPFITFGHSHNKRMGIGQLSRLFNLFIGRIQPPVSDVIADTPFEQKGILQYKGHMTSQAFPPNRSDI